MNRQAARQEKREEERLKDATQHQLVLRANYFPDGRQEMNVTSPSNSDGVIRLDMLVNAMVKMQGMLSQELVELRKKTTGSAAQSQSRIIEPSAAEATILG